MYRYRPILALTLLIVLAACTPQAQQTVIKTLTPVIEITTAAAVDTSATSASSPLIPPTDTPAPVVPQGAQAAWLNVELTDARTGQTFRLSDFAGKTVFVEAMATWCSNCRAQLRNVRDVIPLMNADQFVFIALSVETNITAADLSDYTERQGFDWTFSVLSPEALVTFSDAFGRSFTNPPATPHFIIKPDGTTAGLTAGRIHSVEQLVALLNAAAGN
jgi:peroxiredoxin